MSICSHSYASHTNSGSQYPPGATAADLDSSQYPAEYSSQYSSTQYPGHYGNGNLDTSSVYSANSPAQVSQ